MLAGKFPPARFEFFALEKRKGQGPVTNLGPINRVGPGGEHAVRTDRHCFRQPCGSPHLKKTKNIGCFFEVPPSTDKRGYSVRAARANFKAQWKAAA